MNKTPNPSIERTCPGKPGHASHLKRWTSAIRFPALAFAFATSVAMGQTMKSAKAEAEDLLNAALPFAEKMLGEHGEFFPYAEAMGHDGKFIAIGASEGREQPPSKEVIQLLKNGLKAGAKAGKFKATALVYDVRITLPPTGTKSDAIAVSLNHQDKYSVVLFFPYRLEGKRVVIGNAVAQREENYVFTE